MSHDLSDGAASSSRRGGKAGEKEGSAGKAGRAEGRRAKAPAPAFGQGQLSRGASPGRSLSSRALGPGSGGQRPVQGSLGSRPRYQTRLGAWRPVRKGGARKPARRGQPGPLQPPPAQGVGAEPAAKQPNPGRPRGLGTTLPSMQRAKSRHRVPNAPRRSCWDFSLTSELAPVRLRSGRSGPLGSARVSPRPRPFRRARDLAGPASGVLGPLFVVRPRCQSGARGQGCSLIGGLRLAPTRKGGRDGRGRGLGAAISAKGCCAATVHESGGRRPVAAGPGGRGAAEDARTG